MVKTWFDTLRGSRTTETAAIAIMAKQGRGHVEADYKSYDAGTTIFTREQNLDGVHPGYHAGQPRLPGQRHRRLPRQLRPRRQQAQLDGLFDSRVRQRGSGVMTPMTSTGVTDTAERDSPALSGRAEWRRCHGGPGPAGPRRCWPSAHRSRAGTLDAHRAVGAGPVPGLVRAAPRPGWYAATFLPSPTAVLAAGAEMALRVSCSPTRGPRCSGCCSGSGWRCWSRCRSASSWARFRAGQVAVRAA